MEKENETSSLSLRIDDDTSKRIVRAIGKQQVRTAESVSKAEWVRQAIVAYLDIVEAG